MRNGIGVHRIKRERQHESSERWRVRERIFLGGKQLLSKGNGKEEIKRVKKGGKSGKNETKREAVLKTRDRKL